MRIGISSPDITILNPQRSPPPPRLGVVVPSLRERRGCSEQWLGKGEEGKAWAKLDTGLINRTGQRASKAHLEGWSSSQSVCDWLKDRVTGRGDRARPGLGPALHYGPRVISHLICLSKLRAGIHYHTACPSAFPRPSVPEYGGQPGVPDPTRKAQAF